jgi:hypothetical protein
MAKLRHLACRNEVVNPHAKQPGSRAAIDAICSAIDFWAERETGHREYFWGRPPRRGGRGTAKMTFSEIKFSSWLRGSRVSPIEDLIQQTAQIGSMPSELLRVQQAPLQQQAYEQSRDRLA